MTAPPAVNGRSSRADRLGVPIEIVDELVPPTPARSPAIEHPEGYLEVDAYIARDGLLEYSDGRSTWTEYRPREELEAAAASWNQRTPVTDDHPSAMVSAATWTTVAKGLHVGPATIEVVDGVAYLRARLLVTDADLVRTIRDGKRETSIGFTARIVPTTAGVAPDGTRADAVQTELAGNHTAIVARGRAGPAVRVLLDGAHIPVYDAREIVREPQEDPHVTKPNPAKKTDQMGAPAQMVEIVGPDGQPISVPSWVAALLAEHEAMKQAQQAAAQPPPAPAAEAAAAPPPAPAPQPEEEKPMTPDAIAALVRRRGRLVRLASDAGVAAAKCDSADEQTLAREFIAARAPWMKARADAAEGDVLDALVDAVADMPAPQPNPFELKRPRADKADPTDPEVIYLAALGY